MQILRLNTWAHILTPPLPSCVTLDKILNSPVSLLSTTEYNSNSASPIRLWGRLNKMKHIKGSDRASLVAQWLRICLLMQGTRVRALVWEDPTCHGAAGPVSHNY